MSLSDGLRDSYRKGGFTKETKYTGSRAYQKFFEDYEEVYVPKKNGKGMRIERIYRGDWYIADVTDAKWIRNKVVTVLLFMISLVLFAIAAYPSTAANQTVYVTLMQAVSAFMLFLLLVYVCTYAAAGRKMTIYKYKHTSDPLKNASSAACAALLVTALAQIICLFAEGSETGEIRRGVLCTVLYLLAAGSAGLIRRREQQMNYRTESAEDESE